MRRIGLMGPISVICLIGPPHHEMRHNFDMLLEGKKGLVLSVTNQNSIGWGIADLANRHGATVGVGGQNEKTLGRVQGLIEGRERMDPFMVDFQEEDQLSALAEQVAKKYG